jgi:NAD(P)-dependent dehydrogenase (short-subunit alcohol dehydrogenase family)
MSDSAQTIKPLAGQSALVTGASSGIGAQIAKALAAAGANVGVNYAGNQDGAEAVVQEITQTAGKAVSKDIVKLLQSYQRYRFGFTRSAAAIISTIFHGREAETKRQVRSVPLLGLFYEGLKNRPI